MSKTTGIDVSGWAVSEQVLARHLVAFMIGTNLLHQAICAVQYHCIAMAIKTASK